LADLQPDAFLVNLLVVLARVAYNVGDDEGARIVGARLAPYAGRNSVGIISICTGPVDWALGLCAATTGDYRDAVARYESARALCRRMGAPPFEARVELAWAQALARRGDSHADVQQHAGPAYSIAHELGIARVARQAEELLAVHPALAQPVR
jgi:hypothetical protein